MQLKPHFNALVDFLKPFSAIWQNEVLELYPNWENAFPPRWGELIESIPLDDFYMIEGLKDFNYLPQGPLRAMATMRESLCSLSPPSHTAEKDNFLQEFLFFKVKAKKRHEIESLLPSIKNAITKHRIKNVVDYGAGLGHLSRAISTHLHVPTICIESNQILLKKNIGRYLKDSRRVRPSTIHFCQTTPSIRPNFMGIGLHTCGSFSNQVLDHSVTNQAKAILHFPCCYFKGHPQRDFNISQVAKKNPLTLSSEALTLASGRVGKLRKCDYDFKLRVKKYRYALHLLFIHKLGISGPISVGNTHKRDYLRWDFASYAANQVKRIGRQLHYSSKDLNQFFKSHQLLIDNMIKANFIRNIFGRALELCIILDRALFLVENNYSVLVSEYFDRQLSPRNIGINAAI